MALTLALGAVGCMQASEGEGKPGALSRVGALTLGSDLRAQKNALGGVVGGGLACKANQLWGTPKGHEPKNKSVDRALSVTSRISGMVGGVCAETCQWRPAAVMTTLSGLALGARRVFTKPVESKDADLDYVSASRSGSPDLEELRAQAEDLQSGQEGGRRLDSPAKTVVERVAQNANAVDQQGGTTAEL